MKLLVFISLLAPCAICVLPHPEAVFQSHSLVGAKQCTWGPSYWCSNLTAAAGCHAVKHCIQTVWEHKQVPEDTDSVCQTCLKMVKEARDQLESNETEEEIKEVFEGSCKLIPIKLITKECCKLVDDFIPELIDTLASQMNPQVVCSVAGLCNSARVDKLLADQGSEVATSKPSTCDGCHTVVDALQNRFEKMTEDQVLQAFLQVCGHLGSLSDGCSNIIITYFKDIYEHLQNNFNSNDVCLLTGECSAQFHTHASVEITPLSKVGFVPVGVQDGLPCEFCEQLVNHLKTILVANTTQEEFKKVLHGLCKQMKEKFRDECGSLVDEYYATIFNFLVSELDGAAACTAIGLCPQSGFKLDSTPLSPLLPVETVPKVYELTNGNDESAIKIVPRPEIQPEARPEIQPEARPETMQLPIERIFPSHLHESYNKQVCIFCEYFLHYIQEAITNPATEEQIKEIVDKACYILPSTINETCISFVDTYGDAFVAVLAQEIDPSVICPLIRACPSSDAVNVEVFFEEHGEQPKCPLCLFAVTKLEEMVKNQRTVDFIKKSMGRLCSHFSGQIAEECQDFVNTYSKSLIEMLIADFTPQEVCVYLKLCVDKMPAKPVEAIPELEDLDILTNEIPDYTKNGKLIPMMNKPVENKQGCIICEFAMTKLQNILKNKTTEEEIKEEVLTICKHLPKAVKQECTDFVEKYADMIIELLIASIEPEEICTYIGLCEKQKIESPSNLKSPQCMICKLVMGQLEQLIVGNVSKADIKSALRTVCTILPRSEEDSCRNFINKNGDMIASLILQAVQPSEICSLMFLCSIDNQLLKYEVSKCALCEAVYMNYVNLANNKKSITANSVCKPMVEEYSMPCYEVMEKESDKLFIYNSFGIDVPTVCSELKYCKQESYHPRFQRQLIGSNKCTWGPGYWCDSVSNADECGSGARAHCEEKVWLGKAPPA